MDNEKITSGTTEYRTEGAAHDPVIDCRGCCIDEATGKLIYNCAWSDDLSYISGYDEEGNRARYYASEHTWLYGEDIKKHNLITFDKVSPEEHKRISSIGGTHTQVNNKSKRTLNDIAKQLLEVEISEKAIDEILGEGREMIGEERAAGVVMMAKMIQTACAGSFKAAEFVRDTAGYKTATRGELDISADIMTDADRSLLDKLQKRIG